MKKFLSLLLILALSLLPACASASGLSFPLAPKDLTGGTSAQEPATEQPEAVAPDASVPTQSSSDSAAILDPATLSDEELVSLFNALYGEMLSRTGEPVPEEPAAEGLLILDQEGVRVTVTNTWFDSDYDELGFDVVVENRSGYSICLAPEYGFINGKPVDSVGVYDVRDGDTVTDYFYFYPVSKADCSEMDDVETVEFFFNVYDSETYDDLFDSDFITIEP